MSFFVELMLVQNISSEHLFRHGISVLVTYLANTLMSFGERYCFISLYLVLNTLLLKKKKKEKDKKHSSTQVAETLSRTDFIYYGLLECHCTQLQTSSSNMSCNYITVLHSNSVVLTLQNFVLLHQHKCIHASLVSQSGDQNTWATIPFLNTILNATLRAYSLYISQIKISSVVSFWPHGSRFGSLYVLL